jgi:triacylglycerol lipase
MWNTIRGDVLHGLRERAHTGRLIITGISLGGALSCLSYVDIVQSGIFENIEIITFGAPRVGNRNWADWFDSTTPSTRYFIKGDPISILPRCLTLICNYKQTGTPIVCNKNLQQC